MANTARSTLPANVCLISAYDSSGHAGHSCDLRTVQDLGSLGLGVISALTAQNSQRVLGVNATNPQSLAQQCEALLEDTRLDAVKVGMLADSQQLPVLAEFLKQLTCPVIADPVFGSSSGTVFVDQAFIETYKTLLPLVTLLTPNRLEAEQLTGLSIRTQADTVQAADTLRALGAPAVLIKGGHSDWHDDWLEDYFDNGQDCVWLRHQRQHSETTRGTGCTLSSAIATFMAQGKHIKDALVLAEAYVQQGMRSGFSIGQCGGLLGNCGRPERLSDYPQLRLSDLPFDLPAFPSCGNEPLGLYPLVDSITNLQQCLDAGVKSVQLRIKTYDSEEHLDGLIAQAVELARHSLARLFINDHWQLAIKHNAYGVHLGQEDLNPTAVIALNNAKLRLGVSSHSEYEWLRSASIKPSYIAMGAVFGTASKNGVEAIGTDNLQHWTTVLKPHFPLVAIGGIDLNNIDEVTAAGINSCAVIGALTSSGNIADNIQRLQQALLTKNTSLGKHSL